jgi:hypothetical protein
MSLSTRITRSTNHMLQPRYLAAPSSLSLGLGNVQTLAHHSAPMKNEHGDHRMKLKHRSLKPQTHGHLLKRPSLVHPVRHNLHNDQRHRDWGTLKVLALARFILRHHSNRNIEPRQARKTAQHEESEKEVIDRGAQTETESGGRGRDAEGDEVREGIEFLAHERRLLAPARYFAVHEVEEKTQRDEGECEVEVCVVEGVGLRAVAERGEDGHYAAEACVSLC